MHSFKLHNKENSTTVYGRNTEVRFIDRNSDDTKAFLNKNALFGHHGGSHSVGLFDKKTGDRYGGLVCEYNGDKKAEDAGKQLKMSLNELYTNGFDDKFDLNVIKLHTESFIPKKKYGSALVAICFTNYVLPVLTKRTLRR